MSEAVLRAVDVTRRLRGDVPVTLVDSATMEAAPGDFIAITGPSGSGKSSLLYLLGLLDRPDGGEVFLQGEPTSGLSDSQRAALRLARIGFVFQSYFLLPEFTAAENVAMPIRRLGRVTGDAAMARAAALLASLGLADQARRFPRQLSGGQSQRVAIARALANDPPLLLADEPTGNLDSRASALVFEIFERLAKEGRTVVVVTHDMDFARRAGRNVRIVDGRITD
ncbi:MAG: ABC transporter ATP-binding protein [Alphaproteobacteria bacterium]|nr:ABC transporter ATP-binding protein [Alphaproteobacteria bacterium]